MGIALAVKSQRPEVRIVGVQAEAVAPWRHFLADGGVGPVPADAHTIADGIKVKTPGHCPREVIARHVDAIITVDDDAIAEAMVRLLERPTPWRKGPVPWALPPSCGALSLWAWFIPPWWW